MTSRQLYEEVVRAVETWPAWAHTATEVITEGGLILLALMLACAALRRRDARTLVRVALGLAATASAYVVSALLKLAEAQPRPCRALPELETVAACPAAGDWSLPSNHAVIAAGLAVAAAATTPRLAPLAAILALAVAASRVALGVHYPHDVTTGLLLGAVGVAALLVLTRRVAPAVERYLWHGSGGRRASAASGALADAPRREA